MAGKVTLVGAGPGDAGLLTRKGEKVLQTAEVVVYDRLVGRDILALIPKSAEKVDVGKQPQQHPVPQWRINELLLAYAKAGKDVVRLKGGDPFLFGRGGEELAGLAREGIPFEVVPGVTSALAAPAYGGIPVTHREFASSVHIITGHAKAGAPLNIEFHALVEAGGTCVFLMGVSALGEICRGLLEAGKPGTTPAALVERGTLPVQRKVVATLETLEQAAREQSIQSPAVIIVGEVAALAEEFDWFSKQPLFGERIVVTRPKNRAGRLSEQLRNLGGDVLEYPCIRTVPRERNEEITQALATLSQYEWCAFTSPAGVEAFFQMLWKSRMDSRAVSGLRFAAIGPATAKALEGWRIRADYVPEIYDTEHLALGLANLASGAVLLPRAAMGSPMLTEILTEKGIPFTDLPVYDTEYRCGETALLLDWLKAGKTLVTFTSSSTVRGFVRSLPQGIGLENVQGVSIGKQTAAECQKHGISTVIAQQATIDSLIQSVLEQKTN
ncbi:MAG: uroporphyrinogen-III C-methyltransferase [Oscillospiraceae bacterium]|nr:uroporphyrinogen-III C-methyltransferase [Oscillospiraceae bacterium]